MFLFGRLYPRVYLPGTVPITSALTSVYITYRWIAGGFFFLLVDGQERRRSRECEKCARKHFFFFLQTHIRPSVLSTLASVLNGLECIWMDRVSWIQHGFLPHSLPCFLFFLVFFIFLFYRLSTLAWKLAADSNCGNAWASNIAGDAAASDNSRCQQASPRTCVTIHVCICMCLPLTCSRRRVRTLVWRVSVRRLASSRACVCVWDHLRGQTLKEFISPQPVCLIGSAVSLMSASHSGLSDPSCLISIYESGVTWSSSTCTSLETYWSLDSLILYPII